MQVPAMMPESGKKKQMTPNKHTENKATQIRSAILIRFEGLGCCPVGDRFSCLGTSCKLGAPFVEFS